jgi:hypothetical protein
MKGMEWALVERSEEKNNKNHRICQIDISLFDDSGYLMEKGFSPTKFNKI